ncbi:MAG: nicotinamide-nucleotide adenylyltransferase [Candidatus Parvarchaeum sp.]
MKILFIGRFQPFHNGHLKTLISFYSNKDTIKIVIGSKQESFTYKNPFTYDERKQMIERSLKKNNIANFKIYGLEDKHSDINWFKELQNLVNKFDILYSGNTKVISIFKKYGVNVRKIKRRKEHGISGKIIRKMIYEGKPVESLLPDATIRTINAVDGFQRIKNIKDIGKNRIFTIGHSTRTINEFIGLLKSYAIKEVIDIRTVPKSLHNPQFNLASLKKSLSKAGINYLEIKELGGLRSPIKDSKNVFWRNRSFRGYADYMQTKDFKEGIKKVLNESKNMRIALMCAEVLPWRCHRFLISDYLICRGFSVTHIMSYNHTIEHKINRHAINEKGILVYK